MNRHEEELQKKIESGELVGADLDSIAYREVFRVLSKEPKTQLPMNFSEKIIMKVLAKKQKESARDMWWLGFGVFFLIIGFIVTAVVAGLKFELGFLKDMSSYAGLLVFGAVFILVLNWIDRKVVEKKDMWI